MDKTLRIKVLLVMLMCLAASASAWQQEHRARFEPSDGEVLLFVGQELEAIGGLERYNDGYMDHFEAPAGFTMYTNIQPMGKGLQGVHQTDNWGDGDSNMMLQLNDPDFENMALAIGLSMVGSAGKVARGELDNGIKILGGFIKSLGKRPVFLRIGYEFSGEWNGYNREDYLTAFRRIVTQFRAMEVENVAFVWQSKGFGLNQEQLESWYPGDEYVDWFGFSFFNNWREVQMIEFARKKSKPVFIAEATPTITNPDAGQPGYTLETDLDNPQQAQKAWEEWFLPFFDTINQNPDVVKAVSYINANWRIRPMWQTNPTFKNIDARLQQSPFITKMWNAEISKNKFLKADSGLFKTLWVPSF